LPRTMVTEGVGGESSGPLDARVDFGRIARNLPTLVRKALGDYAAMFAIKKGLRELDADLKFARSLPDLWDLNVKALAFSIRTNFAINGLLAIASKVRRKLGLSQAGRVVTHEMMTAYAELAARPETLDRLAGLDAWLVVYGHRGPLESDPSQPRFAELRETLRIALERGPATAPKPRARPFFLVAAIGRFFFVYDEIREWFRDRLMRWWQGLRTQILEASRAEVERGHLETVEDVFFLRGDDLRADPETWKARVITRRLAWERSKTLRLPNTGSKDAIEAEILEARPEDDARLDRFRGIGLGLQVVTGTAVKGVDLKSLLEGPDLPEMPVLVAETLEPSWAVVFPRFAAVVVDLGGELSHASILLREAEIPAVVNARGAYRAIQNGDRVTVDPLLGEVRIVGSIHPS
jgi:phosphohistidine swiveling domain-containing protein